MQVIVAAGILVLCLFAADPVTGFVVTRVTPTTFSSRQQTGGVSREIPSQSSRDGRVGGIKGMKQRNNVSQWMAKLSELPVGISPFEKSLSKSIDVQENFRTIAKRALTAAIGDGVALLEVEFPPLIGGDKSKSQFDDFDNVQELDRNKDWTMLFVPPFVASNPKLYGNKQAWLVFPDTKECELARAEWAGARYRDAATFTTIEAATNFGSSSTSGSGKSYDAPWAANFASGMSKLLGQEDAGFLGDKGSLDPLEQPATIQFVIQPGNGGPVEDWINCETIHLANNNNPDTYIPMVIINGALDKVRGGYYASVFFPKLAATVDRFFKKFTSAFYLKPISDKGVYGWLYRVYPEPWQVVLQTVRTKSNDQMYIEDTVVHVSETRPTYAEAVSKLVDAANKGYAK
eukprot:scaffold28917_cov49-Attheya_sp.AAC.2